MQAKGTHMRKREQSNQEKW